MPSNLITVYGQGGVRLIRELVGLLDHRRVSVTSINTSVDGNSCVMHLAFEAENEAAVELLTKRINRLVGVVRTELQIQIQTWTSTSLPR